MSGFRFLIHVAELLSKTFDLFILESAVAEGACVPVRRIFATLLFIHVPDSLCGHWSLCISLLCLPKCPCWR